MAQFPPRTRLDAGLEFWKKDYCPNPYRFQCCICEGLLDCREAHTLYVNGQRAHDGCVKRRALENARRDQSSFW